MTIAFDVATTKAETTGDSTWSHTAAGSGVKGALVFIVIRASNTPPVGVTYGGTAMAKIAEANDTGGETGNATAWALNASVPQGSQTVSVDVGAAQVWGGAAISVTGAVDTKNFVATQAENAANPSQAITVPASYVNYSAAALFSGLAAPASVTAGTNYTLVGAGVDFSGGGVSDCAVFERLTTGTTTGNPTVAFTSAIDDVAFVAVAIGEVQAFTSSHTGPNLALAGGTHTPSVGRTIAETSATLAFAGGTHSRTSTRAATAGNLQLLGGNHARTLTRLETAGALGLLGGNHGASRGQVASETAGEFGLLGGTHAFTTGRLETAAQLGLLGGDHTADYVPGTSGSRGRVSWVQVEVPLGTPGVDNTASLDAGQLALAGGTHAISVTFAETAQELAFLGGTHTTSASRSLSHSAANLQLAGGTAHLSLTRAETAAELALLGGASTASAGRRIAETAANLALAGGTHHVSVGKAESAANLQLLGGDHSASKSGANAVSHTAANLQFAGGTHAITVLRRLSAGNLSLAGGSQHFTITRQHVAGHLSLIGGDSTAARGQVLAHLAAELALNGGSFQLSLGRSLIAAEFALRGGTPALTIRRNIDAELGAIAGTGPNGSANGTQPGASISQRDPRGELVSVGDATRGHAHDHGGLGGDVH